MYANGSCSDGKAAALATGNANWKSITRTSMKSTAWTTGGLGFKFSYTGISEGFEGEKYANGLRQAS